MCIFIKAIISKNKIKYVIIKTRTIMLIHFEYKTCWFSELDVMRVHLSSSNLKNRSLDIGFKLFSSEGIWKSGVSFQLYGTGIWLWWKITSAFPNHLEFGIFSFAWCVEFAKLGPGFLSPHLTADSVYTRSEGCLGASYANILVD